MFDTFICTGTSSTTTGTVRFGVPNYILEATGNDYHDVQKVRYSSATNTSTAMRKLR